jgi:transporter family-2 protein
VFAALQARVNGVLGHRLGSAFSAALVSFVIGWVLLAALVLARRAARGGLPRLRGMPWWTFLGGLGGAMLVASAAASAPVIGVALLTVAQVGGQNASALGVDRFGLGPSGRMPVTAPRLGGAVLGLAAVLVATVGRSGGQLSVPLLAVMVVAGCGVAGQVAVNGRLQQRTGDATVAALVNFTVGTVALAALVGVLGVAGRLGHPHWPANPLLYTGGLLGACFVSLAALVVRHVGVLRFSLATVAGQLAGGLVLDAISGGLEAATAVGAVLTVVAVTVSGAGRRRLTPSP